jgi:hypothetical protein
MTPREFVIWLKGFTQAASTFTLTPKQWDDMKEKLDQVDINADNIKASRYQLDSTNWSTTSTINNHTESTYNTDKQLLTETQQSL